MGVCVCACVVMPVANVCSQLDSAICSRGSGGGYNIHMQQSTSPVERHPARHGKPPTLMPRKHALVILDTDDHKPAILR